MFYKFGKNDIFHNRIKAHPKVNFKIYNQQVYYNNQQEISGNLAASPGYIDLYDFMHTVQTLPTAALSAGDEVILPNVHDLTHNPVGLWQFNNDLSDSSGNDNNFELSTGTEVYADLFPGLRGVYFDGATTLQIANGFVSELAISGALTVEMIIVSQVQATTINSIVSHVGSPSGDSQADNYLYDVRLGTEDRLQYFAENAGGVDITFTAAAAINAGMLTHVALTRNSSGDVKFYINGVTHALWQSSGLSSPDGGTNGRLYAGASVISNDWQGALCSLKIIDSQLSDSEVLAEFQRTIGGIY